MQTVDVSSLKKATGRYGDYYKSLLAGKVAVIFYPCLQHGSLVRFPVIVERSDFSNSQVSFLLFVSGLQHVTFFLLDADFATLIHVFATEKNHLKPFNILFCLVSNWTLK